MGLFLHSLLIIIDFFSKPLLWFEEKKDDITNRLFYSLSSFVLKDILYEASTFYNTELLDKFSAKHSPVRLGHFIQFPQKAIVLSPHKALKNFKEYIGCIDNETFYKNSKNRDVFTIMKKSHENIFFHSLKKDKRFVSTIHLYNLSSLSNNEILSILSLPLSENQRLLIWAEYLEKGVVND